MLSLENCNIEQKRYYYMNKEVENRLKWYKISKEVGDLDKKCLDTFSEFIENMDELYEDMFDVITFGFRTCLTLLYSHKKVANITIADANGLTSRNIDKYLKDIRPNVDYDFHHIPIGMIDSGGYPYDKSRDNCKQYTDILKKYVRDRPIGFAFVCSRFRVACVLSKWYYYPECTIFMESFDRDTYSILKRISEVLTKRDEKSAVIRLRRKFINSESFKQRLSELIKIYEIQAY